ncbi:MAG TPA: glycosyltransferase family 9 protein, partial [Candidatus Paceibacterota bacterium]
MTIKKVLTLRASSIGDALMGKYFLENVHAAFPEARCFMLVGSRGAMIHDVLLGYPWLSVVEANRKNPSSLISAWRALSGSDIALTQPAENPFSFPSKVFARLVAKKLIGFNDTSVWNFMYDTVVPFFGEAHSRGMIVEEQNALRASGVPMGVSELSLSYVDDPSVVSKFRLSGKYVAAHLFSGNEGRSISQRKRVEIVRALRSAIPHTLVLTGGTADVVRAAETSGGLPNVLNLAGKTSMQEFINLIARARGVVSLDTGGAHIAAHLKKPLV